MILRHDQICILHLPWLVLDLGMLEFIFVMECHTPFLEMSKNFNQKTIEGFCLITSSDEVPDTTVLLVSQFVLARTPGHEPAVHP
uniref:Uncharacterized protein n=1 Tax=Timema shepardi TaxID=629360 RepID=A0A7R9ARU5_TIMSH|nr:unnamed protein product [Timema shepardi]